MVLSVNYVSESSWHEVCKKVKDGVVFLDDRSAECLHWHGGVRRLLKAGAICLKKFSSFEGGKENEEKGIFLVTDPLVGPSRMILKDVISNSSFKHCIIITPCSPAVLNLAMLGIAPQTSPEFNVLHKLEQDILLWMKHQNCAVEIFHSHSYGLVPINEYLFICPIFSDLFPCFDEDLETKGPINSNSKVSDWDLEFLPQDFQICITYLMTTLNSLLSQLNVREDIYCLGPFSNLIGSLLQKNSTSHLRSKTVTSTMSLLLMDRTLDLCTPVFANSDCFIDLMKATLPPFPGQTIDVAINMSALFSESNEQHHKAHIFPGCLHEPKGSLLDWAFQYSYPEILKNISKEISTVLKEEEHIFSPSDLEEVIQKKFCDFDILKDNSALVQGSLGMLQTLKSRALEKIKLIKSFQTLLLQALASDGNTDGALHQIIDLINARQSKGLELEHIFTILIFFYSFIGEKYEVSPDIEALLITALAKALLEDKEKYSETDELNFFNIGDIDDFCTLVLKKLNSLKTCRGHLFKYRDVTVYQDFMLPLDYQSVLTQLLQDILNPIKIGIPDLRHKPNVSLKDNIASRFSMLLSSTRSHITDTDCLLIFVVGGITGQEVNLIKKFFKHYSKPVIIGSTSLLSPGSVVRNLFQNTSFVPL